jgi:hypothetical protein
MQGFVEIAFVVVDGRGRGTTAARVQLPPEQMHLLRDRLTRSIGYTCPACRSAASLHIAPDQITAGHTCGR